MYIKNVFNIKNYKGLRNGLKVDFADTTYLVGDNAKNKTTIGSIPLWILTGYNMYGSNQEQVANDTVGLNSNTEASMTLIDNDGIEHIITRYKGKNNFVTLDGIKTTQENLTRFYKDVHAFICAYNPYYFRSLKLVSQRELLLRILPAISTKDAFNLLSKDEREILGGEVSDPKEFAKSRRAEIKSLKSDLDVITGSRDTYISIALQKEEEPKTFSKEQELSRLESEYEKLVTNSDEVVSLEDLQNEIKRLDNKIMNNVKIELKELQDKQKKEIEGLNNVSDISSTCPTCKQKIKNENLINALKINYTKSINSIAAKIKILQHDTQDLIDKKKMQVEKYNKLITPEMQEKSIKINELKERIKALQIEKTEIALFNNEASIKHKDIANAKKQVESINNEIKSINCKIELYDKQIKVANRLHLLTIQEQMKHANRYLNKVSIEFSRLNEGTGEIEDIYQVKYDGRNYEKLSKSYKMRADIEIANLINKITKINTPMFIDDIESITNINLTSNTQTILSIVIKYNELEILYSYQDVLIRERESINKKIAESSNLIEIAA